MKIIAACACLIVVAARFGHVSVGAALAAMALRVAHAPDRGQGLSYRLAGTDTLEKIAARAGLICARSLFLYET